MGILLLFACCANGKKYKKETKFMIKEQVIEGFVEELSSKKPVPGGGGASLRDGPGFDGRESDCR